MVVEEMYRSSCRRWAVGSRVGSSVVGVWLCHAICIGISFLKQPPRCSCIDSLGRTLRSDMRRERESLMVLNRRRRVDAVVAWVGNALVVQCSLVGKTVGHV